MATWEGSKADRAADRKGAKRAGVSLKEWEGSAADRKADAMAHKPHESKSEHARAGRKGAKAEPHAAKVKGGHDSHKHLERAAEAKHGGKKPGHMHHHHHHHHHHGSRAK